MIKILIAIIIIALIFVVVAVPITYKVVEVNDNGNSYCDNGTIKFKMNIMGIGEIPYSTACMEYRSSKCLPSCIDGKPKCECQATILARLLNKEFMGWFG